MSIKKTGQVGVELEQEGFCTIIYQYGKEISDILLSLFMRYILVTDRQTDSEALVIRFRFTLRARNSKRHLHESRYII